MIKYHSYLLVIAGLAVLCFFRDNLYTGLARFAAPSLDGPDSFSATDEMLLRSLTFIIPSALILVGALNLWRTSRNQKPLQ
ncbi:hypothetical protein [Sulfuriroseicoccus oceanibius]|uniref:Uncharacterized protein n=1 Tax=Sulfuriroseicoccus oceanibius TaxID=2707525 RepID=A0A6B3LCZ0_9BACT|nr:hypothetical protein [Sulfuriroseicoccus oceanibius]QQL46012.1 hypothetical protein G3M56_005380 [Sulfuriroseicoccus oceanibius]